MTDFVDYDAEQEFECWCPDSYRDIFVAVPYCPRHGDAYEARLVAGKVAP